MLWCWPGVRLFCLSLLFSELSISLSNSSEFGACIFDEIQPENIPKTELVYRTASVIQRAKRETDVSDYKPIRIHTHYFELDLRLTSEGKEKLKKVIEEAIFKISKILSVVEVEGPFRIQRGGCFTSWTQGPNVGKCSQVERNYKGEFCERFIKIPDDHLSGLYTWSFNGTGATREHLPPGTGLPNTDFILYIRSFSSSRCQTTGNLVAYALHCRVDQNGRPVAGYVNFCPERVVSSDVDYKKYYLTTIHELFHALGFSKQLFRSFRECTGSKCSRRPAHVGSLGGVQRLITPAVVRQMQHHFTCPFEQDFGAPLENKEGIIGSHWHSRFLQGSIMAPSIEHPDLTFLDPITLALFEDTGWYKVNYSQADLYIWGRGGGCNFGQENTCQFDTQYFCQGSDTGCHFTHQTKGHCDTKPLIKPCRIYLAKKQDNCTVQSSTSLDPSTTGEKYGDTSRCFLANLTNSLTAGPLDHPAGMCFEYMCPEVNITMVKTTTTDWQRCPYGEIIYVPGYNGSIECPPMGTLCSVFDMVSKATPTPATTNQRPSFSRTPSQSTITTQTTIINQPTTTSVYTSLKYDNGNVLVPVVVVFPSLDVDTLEENGLVNGFMDAVVMFIVFATDIPEQRVKNLNLEKGSVQVLFDIAPANGSQEGPTSEEIYEILVECVDHGNWTVDVPSLGTHTASKISKRSRAFPNSHENPGLSGGVKAGIVIGLLAVVAIVTLAIILLCKHRRGGNDNDLSPPSEPIQCGKVDFCPRECSIDIKQYFTNDKVSSQKNDSDS